MSTDINTSTSNVSTSTLNAPTLVKRFGLIAMIAVLALLMGGKFSNALTSSPSVGGSGHSSFDTGYGYGNSTTTPTALTDIAVGPGATAGSIKVTWTNQANNGATITSFTVANPANTVTLCTQTVVGVAGQANSCTWTPTSANYYHGLINVFTNYSTGTTVDTSTNVSIKVLAAPALTNATAPWSGDSTTPIVGSGTIKVGWTAPTTYADASSASSGLAVTGYAVFLGTTQVCTAAATATTCTVNDTTAGLTPGAPYQFTVESINAGGYSANSAQTVAVNAIYPPAAPTNVTAAVNYATGTVNVAFTAPASNGGSALGAYTYLLNGVGSGVTCTATATSTTAAPKCTIALTAVAPGGSTFVGFITVVAVNTVATATSRANSNSITADTVAPAPAAVRWSSGTGTTSPVVSWTPVSEITANPILGYNVQLETCTTASYVTTVCTASGSPVFVQGLGTQTYTFSGLAYGKIYSVAVSAVNGSGAGGIGSIEAEDTAAAAATYAFNDLSAGAAPTAATTPIKISSYGNGTLTATITAPQNLNAGTVTGYSAQLVSCAAMNTSCPVGAAKTATAAGTLTWTGLTPNSFYAVILTTSYTQADGTTSSTQSVTSATQAIGIAPTTFDYTPTATGATFSWDAPVTGEVKSTFTVAAGSTVLCTVPATATSCDVTTATLGGLIALSNTTVRIWSTDANGVNSASVNAVSGALAQIAKPDAGGNTIYAYGDTDAAFVAGTDSVDVSWTKVAGALSYNVIAIGSDGTTVTATTTGTDYVFAAAELTATSYTYQVSANGSFGNSGYSSAVSYHSGAATAPAAPSIITPTTLGSGSSLTRRLATANGGALAPTLTALVPLTVANGGVLNFGFTVNLASTGNPVQSVVGTLTVDKSTTEVCTVPVASLTMLGATTAAGTCTYFGVLTGKSYTFSVVVVGALSSSTSDSITVLNTAPSGPVTGLKASDASGASGAAGVAGTLTKVSWTAPTTTASTIVGYTVIVLNKYGNAVPCYTTYNGSTATTASIGTSCYFASAAAATYSISVSAIENVTTAVSGYVALSGSIATTAATLSYSTYNVPATPAAPTAALFVYPTYTKGVSITWPAVTDVQGITSYIVTASAGTLTSCTTANGNTISGTNPITITSATSTVDTAVNCASSVATPVQFYVNAVNGTGTSVSSPWSSAVTPVAVPSAPTSVYFNADATTAGGTLYWAASAATTSYKIVVLNASTTQVAATYTVTAPATSYVIPATGLVLGVTYNIQIYALNSGGSSAASSNAGVAGAPSNPTVYLTRASSTATTATLAWVAGASTGGPVTYNVYQTANGLTSVVATGLTVTSYAITSYSPTTTVYSVSEVNAVGANASGPIAGGTTTANTFTAMIAPVGAAVYSSGTAVLSTTSVEVGYTPTGASDAGLAGDGTTALPYSVSVTLTPASGTAITATAAMCDAATHAPSVTCTFTGLSSNTVYTYSITETSVIGSSIPTTGYLVTTATAPGAPTITAATSSVATSAVTGNPVYSVTLTWAAPSVSGSSAVTGYVAKVTTGGVGTYCTAVLTASSTTCTFTALTAYTVYTFSVAAVNAAGTGTAATSIADATTADWTASVTTPRAGQAPVAVVPTLGNTALSLTYPALGSITVTWAKYDATHLTNMLLSYPITSFICTATYAGVTTTVTAAATATSCTFTGLLNKAYTISVVAQNGYGVLATDGQSTPLTATSKAQVSNSPALFGAASVVSGTITVQWQAPVTSTADSALGGANGSAIASYMVTATDSLGVVAGSCTGAATATTCTITGLKNSTTYDVVVTPTNAVGASNIVEHLSVKTISATAPAAPAIISAVRNATGLAVTWTAPATAGSGQLVGYWVSATDPLNGQQYTCPYNATYGLVLAPAVTCSINGLVVGTSYTISITAITKDGAGAVQTSAAGTKTGVVYNTLAPEPVMATFLAVTAKQKSVSALSANAKTSLASLISSINDGAQITITGYGTTKAIALARANAAANYLFYNGAAVHVTVKSVISKTIKTALVTVTQN